MVKVVGPVGPQSEVTTGRENTYLEQKDTQRYRSLKPIIGSMILTIQHSET